MHVCHTLVCFFLLTLQAGHGSNSGLLAAGHRTLTGTEGGRVTVACSFPASRDRKFFCKQDCKQGVLVEMTGDEAENGRYRIDYSKTFFLSYPVLYVSITQLTKSDSGWYSCGLGSPLFPDSHEEFEIVVEDAPDNLGPFSTSASTPARSSSSSSGGFTSSPASPKTTEQSGQPQPERTAVLAGSAPAASTPARSSSSSSGGFTSSPASPKTTEQSGQPQPERTAVLAGSAPAFSKSIWTLGPFSAPAASTPARSSSSSSGGFTSSPASPKTTEQSGQPQPERTAAPSGSGMLLYVGFVVIVMFFLSSLAGLLFCRRRASKRKELPMETEYAYVSDASRVHEDVGEDRRRRSAPVEISSVHTLAKYTKLNEADSTDGSGAVTAATSQNTVEFPNSGTPLLNGAPAGDSEGVVSPAP